MAEPEYPVLKEIETKLKLQWVDTDDYMATQRAIIQVEPDHAYLELPRGRKGDKGDPGNAISFQGIVARTSDLPTGLGASDAAKAWVNTATKALHVWNGDQWFTVNNFAGVDADVQQFSQWFNQIIDGVRAALDAADRAEYWANETIQQVTGDFATRNYADSKDWFKGFINNTHQTMADVPVGLWGIAAQPHAVRLGLPTDFGTLQVMSMGSSRTAFFIGRSVGLYINMSQGDVWGEWHHPWAKDKWFKGAITSDHQTMADVGVGVWNIPARTHAVRLGLPMDYGSLQVMQIGLSKTAFFIGQSTGFWINSSNGDVWGEWQRPAGSGGSGGGGGAAGLKTVGMALTAGSLLDGVGGRHRVLAQVTAPVTRWRIHIESHRMLSNATSAFDLGDVYVGKHAGNGDITDQLQLKSGLSSIAADNEWVSRWVTYGLSEETLIDLDVTGTDLYSYQAAGYKLDNGAWVASKSTPVSIWLELETFDQVPVVAMIGDSTGAGQGADLPVHESALHIAAREHEFIPMAYTYPGSSMSSINDYGFHLFQRWEHLDKPDSVIIQSGSNDIHTGTPIDELRTRFQSIAATAKTLSPVVFGSTVKARYPDSGDLQETLLDYNAYVKSQPANTRGYLDFYQAVSPDGIILAEDAADASHLSTSGHLKLATAFDGHTLSRPPFALRAGFTDTEQAVTAAEAARDLAREYKDVAATEAQEAKTAADFVRDNPISYEVPERLSEASLEDSFVSKSGQRGTTRTIYVRDTGSDTTGDGLSAESAYREITTAVNSLAKYGPVLTGSIVIDVGPGEYKGGIRLPLTRGQGQDDFITIKGPDVGGHPNTPTAVIKHSLNESVTYGILASDGWYLWVENIAINGPFGTGLDVRNGCTLQRRNVHIDGAGIGVNLTSNIMDNARGGIIQNCTQYCVQEMYNVTRSYTGGTGGSTIHRNSPYGIYSKVYTGGHLDYAEFEGCGVAIHIDRGSANLKGVSIAGATTAGITLKDAEVHNESSIVWGLGNARRIISYGSATSESDMWGWSGPATRTGIKPPNTMVRSTYTPVVVTGVTTANYLVEWLGVLPADRITVQGRKVKVEMVGRLNTYARGDIHVQLMVASAVAQTLTIPSGELAGVITATWTLTCTADGNNQMLVGELKTAAGTTRIYYGVKDIDLTSANRTVGVRVTPSNVNDNIEMISAELYA